MPLDTNSVYVDLSILYGSVQIFAAVNREPSVSSFDFTNSYTGKADYLPIVSRDNWHPAIIAYFTKPFHLLFL